MQSSTIYVLEMYRAGGIFLKPVASCPPEYPLSAVGGGPGHLNDGRKYICGIEQLREPCHVLSLGSNGDYSYEEEILARTPCMVYTFDCTSKARSIDQNRHKSIEQCVGGEHISLGQIHAMFGIREFSIMKIDIEGAEWQLLHDWTNSSALPKQIEVEIHIGSSTAVELARLFRWLYRLGYIAVNFDLNIPYPTCAEYLFYRPD